MKPNDVVKFKAFCEPGDENTLFTVIELRGDRVLVQSYRPISTSWILSPQFVYPIADLVIAEPEDIEAVTVDAEDWFEGCDDQDLEYLEINWFSSDEEVQVAAISHMDYARGEGVEIKGAYNWLIKFRNNLLQSNFSERNSQ